MMGGQVAGMRKHPYGRVDQLEDRYLGMVEAPSSNLGTSTTFDDNRPSSSFERLELVSISSMFSRVEPWVRLMSSCTVSSVSTKVTHWPLNVGLALGMSERRVPTLVWPKECQKDILTTIVQIRPWKLGVPHAFFGTVINCKV